MTVDLSSVVDALAIGGITRRRRGSPTWSNGRSTAAAATDTAIAGVFHPLTGRDLERLPEGIRSRARYRLITTADVRTVDRSGGLPPDQIVHAGHTYEANSDAEWNPHGGFDSLILLALATD